MYFSSNVFLYPLQIDRMPDRLGLVRFQYECKQYESCPLSFRYSDYEQDGEREREREREREYELLIF